MRQYGSTKEPLLANYMRHAEHCLSAAGIQYTSDMRVLQSFLIYLETVGSLRGLRSVWIMVGLLVRAAGSLGLNRDGSKSPGLSPFEIEMRRKLWWHICYLDFRIAQCDLPEMALTKSTFDTKRPRNLNDDDIDPDMTSEPEEREGLSDVCYSRVSCMLWSQSQDVLSLVFLLPDKTSGHAEAQARALAGLDKARKQIKEDILYCKSTKKDIHLFIGFVAELLLQQYLLLIRHLDIFSSTPDHNAEEQHRRATFLIAVVCLETKRAWAQHPRFRRWTWVLRTLPQWYPVAIILIHVRALPWGPTCETAWSLALAAIRGVPEPLKRENPLGQSLWRLLEAARLHRESETRRLNANPEIKAKLDQLSRKHAEPSESQSPERGVADFDTSVAADLLAIEMVTSVGRSDDFLSSSVRSEHEDEGSWEWLVNEQTNEGAGDHASDVEEQTSVVGRHELTDSNLGWRYDETWGIEDSMVGYCSPDGHQCRSGGCVQCFHADPALVAALFNIPSESHGLDNTSWGS